jgi:hypothetical protein
MRSMARVVYIHWNQEEARDHARALVDRGHDVTLHASAGDPLPRVRDPLPDVLVISLDRLPSHGRRVAEWFWETKARRTRPIVFVGGKPDKVAPLQSAFRDALFCSRDDLPDTLARLVTPRM